MRVVRAGAAAAALVASVTVAVPTTGAGAAGGAVVVFNGEDNRLNAYDAATGKKQRVIASAADDPVRGLDINAEICFVPDTVPWKPRGQVWFIAGEDTDQNKKPGIIRQGWGIFRLEGRRVGELRATEVGKLVPDSFVTSADNPENYGCGVLPDGRLVTTDVGDQLPQSPATGQLIVWYPTAAMFRGPVGPGRTDFARVPHCKIDVAIGTAGGAHVAGTDVLVASNRPNQGTREIGGVYRYDTKRWPSAPTTSAGCSRRDATGRPLAAPDRVGKSLFFPAVPGVLTTPSDIAASGKGTYYVSSVFTGDIVEISRTGQYLRHVVAGPLGQLTGFTPFGLGVAPDGTIWVADIGIVGPGPGPGLGSIARVRPGTNALPATPETVDDGLEFPDGIGVVVLR